MDETINTKIDLLIKKMDNFIPNKPISSLLHGDLWEGNILFKNKKFVGFIDPGSFYGHNELEISYLRWFNPKFIDINDPVIRSIIKFLGFFTSLINSGHFE